MMLVASRKSINDLWIGTTMITSTRIMARGKSMSLFLVSNATGEGNSGCCGVIIFVKIPMAFCLFLMNLKISNLFANFFDDIWEGAMSGKNQAGG